MPSHEERAREICSPEYFGGVRANDAQHIADVARALAEVEREAYENAAKVADEMVKKLRATHPVMREVAVEIAQSIRSLNGKEEQRP